MRGSYVTCFLFFPFSLALDVYLNPPQALTRSALSPEDASLVLARHLGLELFEPWRDLSSLDVTNEPFVGQSGRDALVLTVDQVDAKAVLPPSIRSSFSVSTPPSSVPFSLSSILSTFLHRAQYAYSAIYPGGMFWQGDDLDNLATFFESATEPSFAAVELKTLSQLRHARGSTSQEYLEEAQRWRSLLQDLSKHSAGLQFVLLTYQPSFSELFKREPQSSQSPLPPNHPPPQQPIGSISTCFESVDSCTNATNSCSGRGKCMEATKSGRTCFVCACSVTKTGRGSKTKTERWVGESCERKDVSAPFALLAGTSIAIVILIFSSISLLSSVGTQALPSTLLATAVNSKKE